METITENLTTTPEPALFTVVYTNDKPAIWRGEHRLGVLDSDTPNTPTTLRECKSMLRAMHRDLRKSQTKWMRRLARIENHPNYPKMEVA